MRRTILAIGTLALSLLAHSQPRTDSLYKKKNLSKTDIEMVMSYYNQDGNHSAVTGGIGTEQLTVYAPSIKVAHSFRKYNSIYIQAGADMITSASTDRIDSIKSSASLHDTRSYGTLGYSRLLKHHDIKIGGTLGFSMESDYFSVPMSLSVEYAEPSRLRTYSASLNCFFDDLRWGRLNPNYWAPVKLIYPDELRYREWYTAYTRQSYNVKFGFTQVLNRRLILGIFPEFTLQRGLLATPFHRVYFNNGEHRVESLPYHRLKLPIGLRLNYFAGTRTILKVQGNYYWDDYGIMAQAVEVEAAIKLSSVVTIAPFGRVYHQSASTYFKPYSEHSTSESYYTSDYDLSMMETYKVGLNLHYAPYIHRGQRFIFDEIALRYAFYYQSNGLQAHIVSLLMDLSFQK